MLCILESEENFKPLEMIRDTGVVKRTSWN